MKSSLQIFTLLFALMLTAGSCKVTEKRLHQGRYDEAISGAVAKLARNDSKENQILVLEEAFRKANDRDMDRIDYLHQEGQPGRWTEILNIYQYISRRQNKVKPLLPLYLATQNRQAAFDMIDVKSGISGAKENAANYLYTHAMTLLERGSRYDAREAFGDLMEIKSYYSEFRDVESQLARASEMGTNKVLFRMMNSSPSVIYRDLEDRLRDVDLPIYQNKWFRYYQNESQAPDPDFEITVTLEWIETSPEKVHETTREVTRDIEDGWKYLTDKEGNFVKDSLGNKIKITKYKTIFANINELHQEKAVSIGGTVKYYDLNIKKIVQTLPVRADGFFENYARSATGNLNALSKEDKKTLGGKVVPFPSDHQMLMDGAHTFKQVLLNSLKSHENILEN